MKQPTEIKQKWNVSFGGNDATIYSEGTIATIDDTMTNWKWNARLMATAPELLSALQCLTHPMAGDDDLEFALEVIKLATSGEE